MGMQSLDRLSDKDLDVLVMIGAGSGKDLAPYRALPVRRILLAEPDPDCLAPLKRLARQDDRIKVYPWAVSGDAPADSPATLQVWNNTSFNSLRPIPSPHDVLPGLRQTAAPSVEVRDIEILLESGDLQSAGPSVLVLEALGETRAILQRLIDRSRIDVFAHVIFKAAGDDLFGTGETAGAVLDLLRGAGYDMVARQDAGFGIVSAHVTQTPRFSEWRALKAELHSQSRRAEDLLAQEAAHGKETERKLLDVSTALDIARTEAEAQKAHAKSAEARAEEAEAARSAAENARAELETALETAREESTVQKNEAAARAEKAEDALQQRDERLKEIEAELAALRTEFEAKDSTLSTLRADVEAGNARADEAEAQAREAQAAQSAVETLKTKLGQMGARAEEAEGSLQQRGERLKDVEARLATAQADAEAQRTRATKAETQEQEAAASHKAALEAVEEKLDRKEADLGIVLRGNAAVQADLMNLRKRFEALRIEKDETDRLLVQVTARLNSAAQYLHLLNRPEEEGASSAPDQIDEKMPRGGAAKARKPTAPRKKRKAGS